MNPRQLREAIRNAAQGAPALASGNAVGAVGGAGGGAGGVELNDLFLAKINAVSGTGSSAKYGFTEQTVVGGTGGVADRVSGRSGTTTANPARFAGTATLAVNDLVLARRNPSDPNEYEVVGKVTGGVTPNCSSGSLTVYRYACDTGSLVETPTMKTVQVCIAADGTLTVTIT